MPGYPLLRFAGAVTHDPAVDAWFEQRPSALGAMAREWFGRLRAVGADVHECVHDGCPVVCVSDAPFAYVNVFTAHAAVGFFHGASLPDPAGLLLGAGKYMRHVKLSHDAIVDATALQAVIDAAYRDIQARVEHEEANPPAMRRRT